MGEHILSIFLKDIKAVRVRCQSCGTCLEVPLDRLDSVRITCAVCNSEFVRTRAELTQSTNRRLAALKEALTNLGSMDDKFTVEFPINLDDRPSAADNSEAD